MDFGSRGKGKVNIFVLNSHNNFILCWLKTKYSCKNLKHGILAKNTAFWQNHRFTAFDENHHFSDFLLSIVNSNRTNLLSGQSKGQVSTSHYPTNYLSKLSRSSDISKHAPKAFRFAQSKMAAAAILKDFKWPYLGNRSADQLRVWFKSRVFEVGGSNGTISGPINSKMVDAEAAALNRSEWRRSVAQCIHLDNTGWIKVKVKIIIHVK